MAKALRDIAPKGHGKIDKTLEGVNKSSVEDAEVYGGKDASVNKTDPETVKFVKLHKVQKHDDRVGNGKGVYDSGDVKYSLDNKSKEPRHGHKHGDDEKVYEAKEAEVSECNMTKEGAECPVHGKADCSKAKMIKEKAPKKLEEVLKKSDPASKWIHDFVHSDNPKFAGKSKEKRIDMALGAKYAAMKEEKDWDQHVSNAVNLLGKDLNKEKQRVAKTQAKYKDPKIKAHYQGYLDAIDRHLNKQANEEFDLEEKLSDEDKAKIQKSLGPKIAMNPNRASYGPARAKISAVKFKNFMVKKDNMEEDLAVPMLEGGKKKKKVEKEQADVPVTYGADNAQGRV